MREYTALEVVEEYYAEIKRGAEDFAKDCIADPFLSAYFPIADPRWQFQEMWWEAIRKEISVSDSNAQRVWMNAWRATFTPEMVMRFGVWFIGVPGSGKSTLSISLLFFLCRHIYPIFWTDGDMRPFQPWRRDTLRFAEEIALWAALHRRVSRMMDNISSRSQSCFTIGSSFCPSTVQRLALEAALHGRLLLVFMNTPRPVCEQRRFTEGYYTDSSKDPGVDQFVVPDETTLVPAALTIDTSVEPLHHSIQRIVLELERRGWLVPAGEP